MPAPSADPRLAEAYFANLHELFRAFTRLPGAVLEEGAQVSRHLADPPNPMFAGAWGASTGDDAAPLVPETVRWLRSRGAPMAFWWCEGGPPSPALRAALDREGFVPFEVDAPVMAASIDGLRWDAPVPPDLSIDPVADAAGLDAWSTIFVTAFEVPEFAARAWVDATVRLGIEAAPWRMSVARLGGEPVGAAMLFCAAGVAGFVMMGVVPAARRKGIGSALQLERARAARALGLRHVVLSAAAMGVSPYTRLGFRDTGATVGRFLWRPGDADAERHGRVWREGN